MSNGRMHGRCGGKQKAALVKRAYAYYHCNDWERVVDAITGKEYADLIADALHQSLLKRTVPELQRLLFELEASFGKLDDDDEEVGA